MSQDLRDDGTASFAGFARLLGCKRSYVTELKAAGRLVLTVDGRRVHVAESRRLVAETRDPARAGVVARHAATRAHQGAGEGAAAEAPPEPPTGDDDAPASYSDPVADSHARRKAKALADKEEALARKALRDEQIELGQLLVADDVEHALRDAAAIFRTTLENLPNTLAPELAAATDEGRIRVLLGDGIEHVLEELSRKFTGIVKREATT
jgi:hypothetical protein